MIPDDVKAKEPVFNEYFCGGRHHNCYMLYLNQNQFSLDRKIVSENCNSIVLFEQRRNIHQSVHRGFPDDYGINYKDFIKYAIKYGEILRITLLLTDLISKKLTLS